MSACSTQASASDSLDRQFMMLAAAVPGHLPRVRALVLWGARQGHGEGGDSARLLAAGQGGQDARIETRGEEAGHGNIGQQMLGNNLLQFLAQEGAGPRAIPDR